MVAGHLQEKAVENNKVGVCIIKDLTRREHGYVKDPDNKDFWIIDEEAAEVVRLMTGRIIHRCVVYFIQ